MNWYYRYLNFSVFNFKLPGERDYAMGKRKEQDIGEPEGSRKKKKKQVANPRPACSWVHFR